MAVLRRLNAPGYATYDNRDNIGAWHSQVPGTLEVPGTLALCYAGFALQGNLQGEEI